jgi:hypothetical protein
MTDQHRQLLLPAHRNPPKNMPCRSIWLSRLRQEELGEFVGPYTGR